MDRPPSRVQLGRTLLSTFRRNVRLSRARRERARPHVAHSAIIWKCQEPASCFRKSVLKGETMNHTVSDDQDDHMLLHRHEGSDAQAGLPARWNTQAPHLTALEALEQYDWSVFPLDQEKKPPRIGGMHPDGTPRRLSWHAYQTQRASKASLLAWARHYASPAWAVITGALSGVIVLDFDGGEGTRLLHQLGLAPHVRTGSGGYHIYFAHPRWPVRTLNGKSARELGQRWPGLDIRADGGYAAFCGRNERGPYVWLREPIPDELGLLPPELRHFLDLPVVPEVMAEYARRVPATNARGQLEAYS